MKRLSDMPVSGKLAAILTITSMTALLLMAAAIIGYDRSSSRSEALQHLSTLGKIVAGNSSAAVTFDDPKAASEVLKSLDQEPDILAGCTYDSSRRLLARYQKQAASKCPQLLTGNTGATLSSAGATSIEAIEISEPDSYIWKPILPA